MITAFTIAHSISLIAASLGWVHLPSRFVESLIALSIAYTAVENIVRPDVRWRFSLTFGFGLIHGLGFASVLADAAAADDVIVPLLCFNVGVELGQLTIVVVALPSSVSSPGARRGLYRDRHARVASRISVLGILWLIERVFEVDGFLACRRTWHLRLEAYAAIPFTPTNRQSILGAHWRRRSEPPPPMRLASRSSSASMTIGPT